METTQKLKKQWMEWLGDPHGDIRNPFSDRFLDFHIRRLMGKVDVESSPSGYASHFEILKRQRGIDSDSLVCRRCLKDLSIVGEARFNDFLVIRAKDCTQPICLSCSKNNPDKYHIRYLDAVSKLKKLRLLKTSGATKE